jgi:hypothetical protein
MFNTLALMLPIAYTQCGAEGTEVCLLVMAIYGFSSAALIKFWSSLYHTKQLILSPKG